MSEKFEVEDMVYFIGGGSVHSKEILHGMITQKDYASVKRGGGLHMTCYHVCYVNDMGVLEETTISPECAFRNVDELLSDLKDTYEPEFLLESFLKERDKNIDKGEVPYSLINHKWKSIMLEGYESAVLDGKTKV